MAEPLTTRKAAVEYLDQVFQPGLEWSMYPFEHGWAFRSIPTTPEEIREAAEPGAVTLVLEASTGRITSHGPYPPRVIVQRYLAAIADGRDPGGRQIYPELSPPDPRVNQERLAPTPTDGSTKFYYFARTLPGTRTSPTFVTVLRSDPTGHRSIRWGPSARRWICGTADYLADDRNLEVFRPIDRMEAARLARERHRAELPTEEELNRICAEAPLNPVD